MNHVEEGNHYAVLWQYRLLCLKLKNTSSAQINNQFLAHELVYNLQNYKIHNANYHF